ncbi:MAG: hypothetical protein CL912_06785 [Deltaproteobacteria bacterium]|nr:hypothetical protein [Deltaproteobacteria bacterium]
MSKTILLITNKPYLVLLDILNKNVDKHLPASADTIRGWTMRTYEAQKKRIQQDLQEGLSKIHITADLWTSGNKKSILGVIGHYIGREGTLKHNVLAVRELQGDHGGENQARVVADVLVDYEIEYKLGFFVGDNAQSNDVLCEKLSSCE